MWVRRRAPCHASRSKPDGQKCLRGFGVGDVSGLGVMARDGVSRLHRPRPLKPDQAAMAAPPAMVFDASGNYLRSWGGAGAGYEWIEREHGIHIDYKGFV